MESQVRSVSLGPKELDFENRFASRSDNLAELFIRIWL